MTGRRIGGIELFLLEAPCLHPAREERGHCPVCLLKMDCGGETGWGECALGAEGRPADLSAWGIYLHHLNRLSLEDAKEMLEKEQSHWGTNKTAIVREALARMEERCVEGLDAAMVFRRAEAYFSLL